MNNANDEYKKACTQVLEVLKYIDKKEYNKIPNILIMMLNYFCDKSYKYVIDGEKSFEEVELSETAKAILANIYTDYLVPQEQKDEIRKQEDLKRYNIELEKRNKYNPDNIFKNKKSR